MSTASLKKIIPCKKDQAVEMVLDIEKYPEFVPWCIEGKVFVQFVVLIPLHSVAVALAALAHMRFVLEQEAVIICVAGETQTKPCALIPSCLHADPGRDPLLCSSWLAQNYTYPVMQS